MLCVYHFSVKKIDAKLIKCKMHTKNKGEKTFFLLGKKLNSAKDQNITQGSKFNKKKV